MSQSLAEVVETTDKYCIHCIHMRLRVNEYVVVAPCSVLCTLTKNHLCLDIPHIIEACDSLKV